MIADPRSRAAVGRACRATNVDVDARGLIYLVDRNVGFHILELDRG